MKLLVLWLDGCDALYATKENMPNLYQLCGSISEITTKARIPAISAKAMRYILMGSWDLKGDFESLKNELKTTKDVVWEKLPFKVAILFFTYVQNRISKNVYYSEDSQFFSGLHDASHETRAEYVEYSDRADLINEEYLLNFLKTKASQYDMVMVRDDALDAYSHVEVGLDLAKRFQSKDKLIKYIVDLGVENIIIFSDHGAFHNPVGAFFAYHLPFTIKVPETFDGINNVVISTLSKLVPRA